MRKVTYKVGTDIALIKYWGKKDEVLRLPLNSSVALNLDGLTTTTTVEFDGSYNDQVMIDGGVVKGGEKDRIVEQIQRLRLISGVDLPFKMVSENTFPRATGLSSSASGMAALTFATAGALEMDLTQKQLSILARQASGSACRCVCGGVVEWHEGETSEDSYAETIFPAEYLDIVDVVVVVGSKQKIISSTEGMKRLYDHQFMKVRLEGVNQKISELKRLIKAKDIEGIGQLVEAEALEFHSMLLTSSPPIIAWLPETVAVMHKVQELRKQGLGAYFTINTGFNLHVLTTPSDAYTVETLLSKMEQVQQVMVSGVGDGPKELTEHLF